MVDISYRDLYERQPYEFRKRFSYSDFFLCMVILNYSIAVLRRFVLSSAADAAPAGSDPRHHSLLIK